MLGFLKHLFNRGTEEEFMSKHFHGVMTYEVDRLVREITSVSKDEWELEFGIEPLSDNRVHDVVEGRIYDNLREWVIIQVEMDDSGGGFEYMNQRHQYDDED